MCFHSQYSYLENFKCSLWATLRCLAGRMWPAGRTSPRPALEATAVFFNRGSSKSYEIFERFRDLKKVEKHWAIDSVLS